MNLAKSASRKPTKSTLKVDNLSGKRLCLKIIGGFGDILMVTPIARWIKKNYKDVKILLATTPKYVPCFTNNPNFDKVINGFEIIKNRDYSFMYDMMIDFGLAITNNEDSELMHGVDAYFKWFDPEIDLNKLTSEDRLPDLFVHKNIQEEAKKYYNTFQMDKKITVGLQLGASSFVRTWNQEYNVLLAKMLGHNEFNVILFDDSSRRLFSGDNIYYFFWTMYTMSNAIAMASLCDIIVAPDSAFIHIAQALKIPLIGIYGAFEPKFRMGYCENGISIKPQEHFDCLPCFNHKEVCPKGIPSSCMKSILPTEVYSQIVNIAKTHYTEKNRKRIDLTNKIKSLKNFPLENNSIISRYNEKSEDKIFASPKFIKTRIEKAIEENFDAEKVNSYSIVDMGCGKGDLLNELNESLPNHCIIRGIDINTKAKYDSLREYGDKIFNKIYVSNILNINSPSPAVANQGLQNMGLWNKGEINIIVLNQLLEHFPIHDIIRTVQIAKHYMHSKGMMYILTDMKHGTCKEDDLSWILKYCDLKIVDKEYFKEPINGYELIVKKG